MTSPPHRPAPGARSDTPEVRELRALRERKPELAEAIDMHLELPQLQRRVQSRVPQPWFELNREALVQHEIEARPLLRFEDIPVELTELRLTVRQTSDVLRRYGTLDDADYHNIQTLGRDSALLDVVANWYRAGAERRATPLARTDDSLTAHTDTDPAVDQVVTLAMRPFLSRCAEVLQQSADLGVWAHPFCALCGGDPEFAVITPAAERHLICGRCTLRWKFDPLICPYCRNSDRTRITSFTSADGRYRVYACDVCRRYLKAYDARRAARPVMPVMDMVATLPLDAAAMQRGYVG